MFINKEKKANQPPIYTPKEDNNNDFYTSYVNKPMPEKPEKTSLWSNLFKQDKAKKNDQTFTADDDFYDNSYEEPINNELANNVTLNTSSDNFWIKNKKTIWLIIFSLLVIIIIWFLITLFKTNQINLPLTTNLKSFGIVRNNDYQINILADQNDQPKFTTESDLISLNPTTGYVKGLKLGQANITITNKKGQNKQTITVYVVDKRIPLTNINIENNITLTKNSKAIIPITITPNNATELTFQYQVADKQIINVNNGIIEGKKRGTTTITVIAGNLSQTINVTVK